LAILFAVIPVAFVAGLIAHSTHVFIVVFGVALVSAFLLNVTVNRN
jgi:hypothetical protein